jgi:ribosomal protein S18 acetylase RimI-like enzyme
MIRRAIVKDAAAVHALLWSARNEIPLTDQFNNEEYRTWVRDECKRQNVWIMEKSGQVAGVMVMKVDEIFYLVTDPVRRRSRVGECLILHAMACVQRKYGSPVFAKVRPDNFPIVELLTKLQFVLDPDRVTQAGWTCYSSARSRA